MAELKSVKSFGEINSGHTYLLLISPHEIPHIVLIHRSNYYALTYKGVVLEESFEPYLRLLRSKEKKLLFIDLGVIEGDPNEIFSAYREVDTESITCFLPVRNFLLENSASRFVFELIPELYEVGMIRKVTHLNMEDELDEKGDFEMKTYDQNSIFAYIQKLKERHVERKADISQSH